MRPDNEYASAELLERAAAANLLDYVHAVRSAAPHLQAAAIACAGGIAAFTGVSSPLTTVKGAGPVIPESEIEAAEAFFSDRGARAVVFELAPWVTPDSLRLLERRGYLPSGTEDVVIRRLPLDAPDPVHDVVPVAEEAWPGLMLRINGLETAKEWRAFAEASAKLPDSMRFAVLDRRGEPVGCAQALSAAGVCLFANDATLPSARNQGCQTSAIRRRLQLAACDGIEGAAAEVAPGSASERNYFRCGFRLAYCRTYYVRRLV